jgi:predicted nucleic acid-binding protein
MSQRWFSSSPYPNAAFIVTSGFYALLDRADTNHTTAVRLFRDLSTAGTRLVLTNFIRAETHALILNRLGHDVADRFLAGLRSVPSNSLARITDEDETAALDLIARYRDKSFSLTDATSFVVMERLGITHAVSFDDDFRQYGWILLAVV